MPESEGYFNVKIASMLLKYAENVVWVSNNLDWVRRQVTQRLIQITAVCIWKYSREWRVKGLIDTCT